MKKLLALVLAIVCVWSLSACGAPAADQSGSQPAAGAPASGNPVVKIGVYEPASGDNGAGGKQETLGVEFANAVTPTVEIGGKTYDVQLVKVDNESSNDKAASAASTLVSAGVSVVLGSYGSGVSIAASPTFEAAGIPCIGITCTNPQVTEGNKHYFRVCFLDPFQGTVLANYAFSTLNVTKAYCLSKLGDDYSGGLVNYFVKAFEALGGTCVQDIDVTVTTFYPEGANAEFDNSFKEWVKADATRLANNGGDDTVSAVTAMGYDAYYFALAAMQKAASTDAAAIMTALWSTEYDGVSGHIALDQVNGDAIRNTAYVKHCNTETGKWDALPAVTVE